jgi:hypothetical protein
MQRQSIANYTTTIAVEKTVAEICTLLARAKAIAVLSEYDGFGTVSAISFRINTEFGILSFRLPANVAGVLAVLQRSKGVPRSLRSSEQAARVAWRIVLHWLDAQLAMIQAGLVKFEQVFLPYAQDAQGVTVYDRLREQRFSQLALTDK